MLTCIEHPHPHLHAHLEHGILCLSIQRQDAKNALDLNLYHLLRQAFEEADLAPQVRVLILKGNDTDFSAGNDMKSFLQLGELPQAGEAGNTPPFMMLKAAAQFTKPCIAAVKGACIGVANTLLLHFDMVYAARNTIFQLPFVSLGLSLEGAASLLLVQRAGYVRAAELLFCAEKYDAEKALQAGIINAITDDPDQLAEITAQRLSDLPLASLIATKALMKHNLKQIMQCIDQEAEVVIERARSPEMFEAVSAFMQKRKPDFKQFNA